MYEAENTFRALSNDYPLVTSIWCRVGLHKYTKYTVPDTRKEGLYDVLYQLRGCDHCGVVEIKVLRKY
jgi:hypothetical protein